MVSARRRVLCASTWVWVAASLAVADSPREIFERGNTAYEGGDYEQASQAYRAVLRYRIRDPILEYNLGNAEFRLGHLGQAILHYERARRLDPGDPEIQANLSFARSFCFDRVEPPNEPAPLRWLFSVQDHVGPDVQAWGILVVVWLGGVVVASALSRPGGFGAVHGWILAILFAALLAGLASWYVTYQRLEGRRLGVVLEDIAEVLAGPGPNNPALFTVHEGLTLEVRAEREEWLQVSLPNGLNGWVPRQAVELV